MSIDTNQMPDVIPMTQMAVDSDGKTVIRKVKPLAYALMCFVKVNLGLEDTINISEDEDSAQWSMDDISEDDEMSTKIYIDVGEDSCLISIDIYPANFDISSLSVETLRDFILENNMHLHTGQLQLSNGHLRYHSSIDVEGLASEDSDYQGPHLVHPRLIMNMFRYGRGAMDVMLKDLKELKA